MFNIKFSEIYVSKFNQKVFEKWSTFENNGKLSESFILVTIRSKYLYYKDQKWSENINL